MGCDIHLYLERKRSINSVNKWVNIDSWKVNPYFGEDGERPLEHKPVYRTRAYDLFSILADVRNRGNITPISQPRGTPDDISPPTKAEFERWEGDGHSHSWFTLKELMDEHEKRPRHVDFNDLIEKLTNACREELWCDFLHNDVLEGFRIVFWFDN